MGGVVIPTLPTVGTLGYLTDWQHQEISYGSQGVPRASGGVVGRRVSGDARF